MFHQICTLIKLPRSSVLYNVVSDIHTFNWCNITVFMYCYCDISVFLFLSKYRVLSIFNFNRLLILLGFMRRVIIPLHWIRGQQANTTTSTGWGPSLQLSSPKYITTTLIVVLVELTLTSLLFFTLKFLRIF